MTELETIIAWGWFVNCVFTTFDRAIPVPAEGEEVRGTLCLKVDFSEEAIRGVAADDIRGTGLAIRNLGMLPREKSGALE